MALKLQSSNPKKIKASQRSKLRSLNHEKKIKLFDKKQKKQRLKIFTKQDETIKLKNHLIHSKEKISYTNFKTVTTISYSLQIFTTIIDFKL